MVRTSAGGEKILCLLIAQLPPTHASLIVPQVESYFEEVAQASFYYVVTFSISVI